MSRKSIVMMGMVFGSCAGGYAVTLLGADVISFPSLLGSTAGGLFGIWIAVKFSG